MNFVLEYMAVSLSWCAVAFLEYMEFFVSGAGRHSGPLQGIPGQAETRVRKRNADNRFSCAHMWCVSGALRCNEMNAVFYVMVVDVVVCGL